MKVAVLQNRSTLLLVVLGALLVFLAATSPALCRDDHRYIGGRWH